MTAEVKADPAIPPGRTRVYSVLRLHRPPAGYPAPVCGPWMSHSRLCPEVLALGGLCCPTLHGLATSSASLEISVSFSGSPGYRDGL